MDNAVVRELVDAGIHFGHRVGRWNPKMKPYIFCSRNSIHIVNIKETIKGLLRAKRFVTGVVSGGGDVLFVGTKRQAHQPIVEHAKRCGMPYVSERWLGGTLTNFRTIRSRLGRLEELEAMEEQGVMAAQGKKMQSTLRRELGKIKRNLDGIRKMDKLPSVLMVIDARREHIAISEARKLRIPTVCLLDTDSDPDIVDLPIPGNDDAMRGIELILAQIADSAMEGKAGRDAANDDQNEKRDRPRSKRVSVSQAAEAMTTETVPQDASTQDNAAPDETPSQPDRPAQTG